MSEIKKQRARAIIFYQGKIVSMYREFEDRVFYTFPGGGLEAGETEEECVIREVMEEFGLDVLPIKKVYIYERGQSVEHFYICKYISGEFGTGEGEEFSPQGKDGLYKPTLIEISSMPTLPLMPPEVATAFFEDYSSFGENLSDDVRMIFGK